jgi:hypothetical protein
MNIPAMDEACGSCGYIYERHSDRCCPKRTTGEGVVYGPPNWKPSGRFNPAQLRANESTAQADPRRDLFAAAALTGIMAGVEGDGGPFTERDYARRAWEFADAMLATEPK